MANEQNISIREFAKLIKVDESAVRRAIAESRFTTGYDFVNKKIDAKAALKDAWVIEQKVVKQKRGVGTKQLLKKLTGDAAEQSGSNFVNDIQETLREKELVNLALAKLKLKEAEGKLVDKEAVEKVLYAYGSQLKKALEAIPQRIIDNVRAAPNNMEAMKIIELEIKEVLLVFSNGVELE